MEFGNKLLAFLCIGLLLVFMAGCGSAPGEGSQPEKSELPEGFPADIPIFNGAKRMAADSVSIGGQHSLIVAYAVESKLEDVVNIYKEYMEKKGYSDIVFKESEKALGNGADLTGNLNENHISVSFTDAKEIGDVIVSITYKIKE